MISMQCGADGQAFVAGGGLNPSLAEGSTREKFAIGDAVQCTSTGHCQIPKWHLFVQLVQEV